MSIRICIAVFILISAIAHAERPHSIMGFWHFDIVRTTLTHAATKDPEGQQLDSETVDEHTKQLRETLKTQAQFIDSKFTLEVTEHRITLTNTIAPTVIEDPQRAFSYQVVGGNSALLVLKLTDEDGKTLIGHIHLVDGGIAIEQTDCETYPSQCEAATEAGIETSSTTTLGGNTAIDVRTAQKSGPQLLYFKRPAPEGTRSAPLHTDRLELNER